MHEIIGMRMKTATTAKLSLKDKIAFPEKIKSALLKAVTEIILIGEGDVPGRC